MNSNVKEVTKEDPKKAVCHFCHTSMVNALELGPLYQLEGVSVHYFCLLFSAGLSQNGEDDEGIMGFLPVDILKEIKRGNKLKCKYCRKWNATIGCWDLHCNTSFHYPCGLQNQCGFQFIGKYKAHCSKHKEKNGIPQDVKLQQDNCPICLCSISKKDNTVWPPCCRKGVLFHKRCMMEMGKNHGLHYFKCPLCNDKEIFSVAMRKAGIYIPDRDAAWETPGAYEEHRQQYKRCDAENCGCPKGRDHSSKRDSKPWKIIRCGGCGSSAIHKFCGKLKNLTWRCVTCSEILLGKRKTGEMNISRIQRPLHETFTTSSDEQELHEIPLKNPGLERDMTDLPSSPLPPQSTPMTFNSKFNFDLDSDNVSSEDDDRPAFDPRFAMYFGIDDDEDSGSTEDEEDEECLIFISPDSNVHKQLFGTKVKEISATVSLRRSSEEVKYADDILVTPVSTTSERPKKCPVLPSRSESPAEAEDNEPDRKSPKSQLRPSSSSAGLHEFNLQSENILVENQNNNDISILNCYSLVSDSDAVKAEETETPDDTTKPTQFPKQENEPSSNKEDDVSIVIVGSSERSEPAAISADGDSSDSDLEIVSDVKTTSASQKPAILQLFKGIRERTADRKPTPFINTKLEQHDEQNSCGLSNQTSSTFLSLLQKSKGSRNEKLDKDLKSSQPELEIVDLVDSSDDEQRSTVKNWNQTIKNSIETGPSAKRKRGGD